MTEETEVLEAHELEALLRQANVKTPTGARNHALLQLMVQTGIRCGEALQVTPADVRRETWGNGEGRTKVTVLRLPKHKTKGKQDRQAIPLSRETVTALEVWQAKRAGLGIKGGPLFCTVSSGRREAGFARDADLRPGQPLDSRYVRNLVARLADKAGIEKRVHPHMLRHTALTNLYDKTLDLRLVQQVAGHTTSRMTERYTHVHPLSLAQAMDAVEEE